jgi:hypothetical protein
MSKVMGAGKRSFFGDPLTSMSGGIVSSVWSNPGRLPQPARISATVDTARKRGLSGPTRFKLSGVPVLAL